jgi:hypothetical protein
MWFVLLRVLRATDLQAAVILQGGDVNVGGGVEDVFVLAGWRFDGSIAFEGVEGVAFARLADDF